MTIAKYKRYNRINTEVTNLANRGIYSSAANYVGQAGVLKVTLIDLGMSEGYVFTGA